MSFASNVAKSFPETESGDDSLRNKTSLTLPMVPAGSMLGLTERTSIILSTWQYADECKRQLKFIPGCLNVGCTPAHWLCFCGCGQSGRMIGSSSCRPARSCLAALLAGVPFISFGRRGSGHILVRIRVPAASCNFSRILSRRSTTVLMSLPLYTLRPTILGV